MFLKQPHLQPLGGLLFIRAITKPTKRPTRTSTTIQIAAVGGYMVVIAATHRKVQRAAVRLVHVHPHGGAVLPATLVPEQPTIVDETVPVQAHGVERKFGVGTRGACTRIGVYGCSIRAHHWILH